MTPAFDISYTWQALLRSKNPLDLIDDKTLSSACEQVDLEIPRAIYHRPIFSTCKRFVAMRIHSEYLINRTVADNEVGYTIVLGYICS